jgi:L-Ala-D/L-Glu epimerase
MGRMTEIRSIRFREIVRPLRVTFSTSLGHKDVLRSVIVEVALNDGSTGLGECPTSFSSKKETIPAIKRLIGEASPCLVSLPADEYGARIEALRRDYPGYPMTISGLEVALFRAGLASQRVSEHTYWGGRRSTIGTDITIPFIPDGEPLRRWIAYAVRKGFSLFKVKISGDATEDGRFLNMVCNILRSSMTHFTLRLDGNQGYTAKTFLTFVRLLEKRRYPIELFEQPLRRTDLKGMREVKEASPFPIILDEAVLTSSDLARAIEEDLCHGVNIKIAKSGISESAKILAMARQHHLKTMIGCMVETMTGLSAAIYLASGSGTFDSIDLDSIHFLSHRNSYHNIRIAGPSFVINTDGGDGDRSAH